MNEVKLQVNHCTTCLSECQHFHWSFNALGHNLQCSVIEQFEKKKKSICEGTAICPLASITLQTIRKVEIKIYFPLASN